MQYVELGTSGLRASVLGFGCAPVMGRAGRKQSLRALSAAYDAGVTFFDTARSYGYGESESVLGEFLETKRDQVVLATKFGIVPIPQPRWKRALQPVVRTILDVVPATRVLVGKHIKAQFKEAQTTKEVLHKSLDESLQKLRTGYIDILFIHSAPASVLAQCDLLDSLERLIACGKIRVAGISGDSDVIGAALDKPRSPLGAMQFPINVFDMTLLRPIAAARGYGFIFIANQPFGGVGRVVDSRSFLRELARSNAIAPELRQKLTSNGNNLLPEVVLNVVLQGTGIQVAVTSMMNVSHLQANVKAISHCRFTTEELSWIRQNLPPAMNAFTPAAVSSVVS